MRKVPAMILSIMGISLLIACQSGDTNQLGGGNPNDKLITEPKTKDMVDKANDTTDKKPKSGGDMETVQATEGDFVFESLDFNGGSVSNDIFADYDLTIVNFWGTYCPPCLMEIPMFADLYDNLPGNINFIGICVDTHVDTEEDNLKLALEMIGDMNINYTNIELSETLMPITGELTKSGIPMTVFVDREGNLYNENILGAIVGAERIQLLIDGLEPFLNVDEWTWSYEDGY